MNEQTDPGMILRDMLDEIEMSETRHSVLSEFLYTATECGIIPFKISEDDAYLIAKMVLLSKTMRVCPRNVRM